MKEKINVRGRLSFISLGCSKNLVDSERMLGLLGQDGYVLVPDSEPSDLVIINTCGFIESARQESIAVIEEMLERKRSGEVRGVIVAGCLAERQKETLLEQFPGVDHVVGVFGREEITRVANRLLGGLDEQRSLFRPAPVQAQDDRARLRITPRHLAYLKVSDGCDRFCTFCAIPLMRGKHVTKPIEMVVAEAEELAGDGVRELILVAQDMTYYGVDLYGRPRLAELLQAIEQVDGLDWVRILYCYPQFFTDELFDVLSQSRKIIPYLDMPLQHINDRMLKQMNRRHTRRGDRDDYRTTAGDDSGSRAAHDDDRGVPGRDRRRVCRAARVRGGDQVRASGSLHIFTRARYACCKAARSPAGRSQERTSGSGDGRAAANRLRF